MSSYSITPVQYAIHRAEVNPIFGEGVIDIGLQLEPGGDFYFEISSNDGEGGKIPVSTIELQLLIEAAEMLLAGVEKKDV